MCCSPWGRSRLVRQMLEGWLDVTDDEEREAVTDTVFSLLESTGEEKFSGISESRWKSMTAMASSARKLPKGALQGLAKLVALMGQSGVKAASSYISGKTSEKVHNLVRHPKKKAGDEENDEEKPE